MTCFASSAQTYCDACGFRHWQQVGAMPQSRLELALWLHKQTRDHMCYNHTNVRDNQQAL